MRERRAWLNLRTKMKVEKHKRGYTKKLLKLDSSKSSSPERRNELVFSTSVTV